MNNSITIFTPTFNRKAELVRLYNSLMSLKQEFTWLIVDDGSSDDTFQYIQSIKESSHFNIEYIYQQNSGKHIALNTGVSNAKTEWFFIVDSDDLVTSDCIVTFNTYIPFLPKDISAVCFRKGDLKGKLIGASIAGDELIPLRPNKAGELFKGDLAYLFKTNVLKNHPFPVVKNEKFVPELYIWNKAADDGPIYYHPSKVIYLCEYLPNGYSANFKRNLKSNPKGFMIFYWDQIKRSHNIKLFIKSCIRCSQCFWYSLIKKLNLFK